MAGRVKTTWDDMYSIKFRDTHLVREAAIEFEEKGRYTNYDIDDPLYELFWDKHERRSLYGDWFPIGPKGELIYIPGYYYWYLNFSPIMKLEEWMHNDEGEPDIDEYSARGLEEDEASGRLSYDVIDSIVSDRIEGFPDFWDGDFWRFKYVDDAERHGMFGAELKVRGVGSSFKGSSMPNRNYFLIPKSASFLIADEKDFLLGDGILQKAWNNMSFIDKHTAWGKRRQRVNTLMQRRASYEVNQGGVPVESGYMSFIAGITTKNDPNKTRGIRGKLIICEEAGKDPHLLAKWQILKESVKRGRRTFGFMMAQGTGGCVCAGTKVWTNSGDLVNIETLNKQDGIIGFDGIKASKEKITYWQKPINKPCYRITTNTGRYLECSDDHPILALTGRRVRVKKERCAEKVFLSAKECVEGTKIAIIDNVNIFGQKAMWSPRVVGWLIGDGTYGHNQTARIANCEEEIIHYLEKTFDTKILVCRLTKDLKIYKELRIKGVRQKLRELGIIDQTGLNKTLPIGIHQYQKDDIRELLGGLFDTDGYVNIRKNKTRGTYVGEISISSMSESLLNEIRFLLHKFGIHGRMRKRLPRKNNLRDKNPWFEFTIADTRSLLSFAKNIPLFPAEKKRRLEKIIEVFSNVKPNSNQEAVRIEKVTSLEYIGVKPVYNLTANNTNTYIANGIITHNTQGGDYTGLKELFWNPGGYNIYGIPNRWSKGAIGKRVAFFWPCYINSETFMDKDGNSDIEGANAYEENERDKIRAEATDVNALPRYKAERPKIPEEATLVTSQNNFPIELLVEHLNNLETDPKLKHYGLNGNLKLEEGRVKFKVSEDHAPITQYPLSKDADRTGCVVVWEPPMKIDGKVLENLYLITVDPYYQDQGDSLGAVYVYKKINNFNSSGDILVASYVGRPKTLNDHIKTTFYLARYYNALIAVENDKGRSYKDYADRFHLTQYLYPEFDFKYNTQIKKPMNTRGYGYKMASGKNDPFRITGEMYLASWLQRERPTANDDEIYLNLHTIKCVFLIKQLIDYTREGNFDGVDAMLGMMYYINETQEQVPEKNHEEYDDPQSYFHPQRTSQMFQGGSKWY